jgi:hypothetical protein
MQEVRRRRYDCVGTLPLQASCGWDEAILGDQ